ncbi:hypothetical protein [Kribbella sp. NPDC055071]
MTESIRTHPALAFPWRALAGAMAIAPILLLAGTALLPSALGERRGTDRVKSLQILEDVAPERGNIPLAVVLIGLGLGLLVPAAIGLTRLAGGRTLAVIGTILVTIGAPMGVAANAFAAMVLYRLTDPALPQATAVDVLAYDSGSAGAILFLLYLLVPLGLILLGVTLWRSRAVTWWQAALVGLGPVLAFAAPEGPTGALFTIPFAVAMVLAASKVSRLN